MQINQPAQAASFDCTKAGIQIEHLICADKALSKLDEEYGALYHRARRQTASDFKIHALVRSTAIAAVKERNQKCTNRRCLEKWYLAGKDRLSQRLWDADPTWFEKKLNGRLLYERLNIRSFGSLLGPRLSSVDFKYLNELYPIESVTVYPNELHIDHDGDIWNIKVTGQHSIQVYNAITDASYRTDSREYVYFDPLSDELRVGQISHCNFLSHGSSPDFSYRDSLEHRSVGELAFDFVVPRSHTEVFDAPEGALVGTMSYSVEDVSPKNSPEPILSQKIRVCDLSYNTYIEPSYQVRMKYEVKVLYFDANPAWLNLSSDPNKPAWVSRAQVPMSMLAKGKTRAQVMQNGSSIEVKSNHRLRAMPNTNSEVLRVLTVEDQGGEAIIEPLEVVDDWMRVTYSSPNPYLVRINKNDPNAIQPTVIEGWIKWRESPENEYVNVKYQTLGH